jgi:hypothetical protein
MRHTVGSACLLLAHGDWLYMSLPERPACPSRLGDVVSRLADQVNIM